MIQHSIFSSFEQHSTNFDLIQVCKAHQRQIWYLFEFNLNCFSVPGLNHLTIAQFDFWLIRLIKLRKYSEMPSHMACSSTVNEPCARVITAQCLAYHENKLIWVLIFFSYIDLMMVLLRLFLFYSAKLLRATNLVT